MKKSIKIQRYFKLYPELNHLFTKQVYPGILNRDKDYSLQGRIDRNVTSDIAEFIKKYTYK